jgi:septal ring factor EnvC (AmiA/AmiB activator)
MRSADEGRLQDPHLWNKSSRSAGEYNNRAERPALLVPSANVTPIQDKGIRIMSKKVLIAAAAIVVALIVVKGTWLGSHLRMNACKVGNYLKSSVAPEDEIERLKMEVKNLQKDDDKHVHNVACLAVGLDKMEREVAKLKANLVLAEGRIRQARKEMGDSTFVVFGGSRYTRDDLRLDAQAFKTAEDNLASKEETIVAKRRHLTLEKKKLSELQTTRNQMSNELQRLETALAEERHAQAANESSIDDAGYRKIRKDMESVRDRVNILKKSRELRGELRVPQADDRKTQQTKETDQFIESRFGDAK